MDLGLVYNVRSNKEVKKETKNSKYYQSKSLLKAKSREELVLLFPPNKKNIYLLWVKIIEFYTEKNEIKKQNRSIRWKTSAKQFKKS